MSPERRRHSYRAHERRDVVKAVCAAFGVVAFTGIMIWVLAPDEGTGPQPQPQPFPLPTSPSVPSPSTTLGG